jgi:DNA (cytosine-5)-methyltransferase 1
MRRRKILVADLLCGAGGSSTGCAQALKELGLEMDLVCVNHWPVAIDTHARNHPKARHYCQDISTVRPHKVVPEGYLDLLMASPTCTHHSVARGGKPTSDQQRSDPWHIITWLTELRVRRIIIENVWEFRGWGPIDRRTGKPIKARKGEYFNAWIDTIRRLGFQPEWYRLNAADVGEATTRQRFILMARSDRRRVLWPVATHAKQDSSGELQPWRPARDIIDWSIKGRSIFNRKKPLAAKTLARIHAGAVKFNWPEPFLVILRNHMAGRSLDHPLPTIAANGGHVALATPILLKQNFRRDVQSVGEPAPTIMTVARIGLAEPVIVSTRHGKQGAGPKPRGANEPLPTITAGGSQVAVAEAVIMNGRKNNKAKGTSVDPVPTLDTKGGVWLAEPFILNRHGDGYGVARAHSIDEPAPTANCDGGGYLVEPFAPSSSSSTPRRPCSPTSTRPRPRRPCARSAWRSSTTRSPGARGRGRRAQRGAAGRGAAPGRDRGRRRHRRGLRAGRAGERRGGLRPGPR